MSILYEAVGYSYDHYGRDETFRGRLEKVEGWLETFLSVPGRKVIVYCLDRHNFRWKKHRRKVKVVTS